MFPKSRTFLLCVPGVTLRLCWFVYPGYKIPQVENMGATLDQFDTVDFSENDLRKLDGFPYLPRLKCLLLNNNRIVYVFRKALPALLCFPPVYVIINTNVLN